ncbi:MAG TPA: hypothetical protein VGG74_36035 [Kofleriaceae bacterium]|jgi:hypothetical protein
MKKYLLGMLLVAGVAYGDHHWAPPQAAFDACAKSKQSDPCSFTGRSNRKLDGTCQIPHAPAAGSGSATASAALVCRPQHHMHGGGSGSAH